LPETKGSLQVLLVIHNKFTANKNNINKIILLKLILIIFVAYDF